MTSVVGSVQKISTQHESDQTLQKESRVNKSELKAVQQNIDRGKEKEQTVLKSKYQWMSVLMCVN